MFEVIGLCICSACLSFVCCFASGTLCLMPSVVDIRNNFIKKNFPGQLNWVIGTIPADDATDDGPAPEVPILCCENPKICPRNMRILRPDKAEKADKERAEKAKAAKERAEKSDKADKTGNDENVEKSQPDDSAEYEPGPETDNET